jgi:two-component system response regulator
VEDNLAEIRLLREALKTCQSFPYLHVVTTGEEALAFLRCEGPYVHARRPDVIILDLNLPGKHGLEVLAELSADPALRQIPSIVLSTSQHDHDIQQSYALCANCYITKPLDFERFERMIQTLGEFWFGMVQLPRPGNSG